MTEISKQNFAELIGKSSRWVSKLIEAGLPVMGGGGRGIPVQIDSKSAIQWFIEHEVAKRLPKTTYSPEDDEDRLLKKARREEIELRLAVRRGELGPIAGFEEVGVRIATLYSSQLDGLSSRVAGQLAAMDNPAEIRAYLHNETRQIRQATADQLVVEIRKYVGEVEELNASTDDEIPSASTDKDSQ